MTKVAGAIETVKGRARKKNSQTAKTGATPKRSRKGDLPTIQPADNLYLTGEAERAIYNRLSRLEGQVRGVKKMLADHKSCDDMLVQVSALKQAVNGIAAELLQAHMETCVLGSIEAGEGQTALASLRDALAKVMKHG
jgi:DNA-binding FrmR family transcriptional regulator